MEHIGEKIRKVLEERGISQKQFAIETGIAAPKLNLILTGKRRLKIEELEIICYVLNVDFNTLHRDHQEEKCVKGVNIVDQNFMKVGE